MSCRHNLANGSCKRCWPHNPLKMPQAMRVDPGPEEGYSANLDGPGAVPAPARPHIVDGEFQSDKYPTCPPGKVPLSVKDPTAQDLLWQYAQRRRAVDAEFAADLEFALRTAGYQPPSTPTSKTMVVTPTINAVLYQMSGHATELARFAVPLCDGRVPDAIRWNEDFFLFARTAEDPNQVDALLYRYKHVADVVHIDQEDHEDG